MELQTIVSLYKCSGHTCNTSLGFGWGWIPRIKPYYTRRFITNGVKTRGNRQYSKGKNILLENAAPRSYYKKISADIIRAETLVEHGLSPLLENTHRTLRANIRLPVERYCLLFRYFSSQSSLQQTTNNLDWVLNSSLHKGLSFLNRLSPRS